MCKFGNPLNIFYGLYALKLFPVTTWLCVVYGVGAGKNAANVNSSQSGSCDAKKCDEKWRERKRNEE